jgi:hypothetical protein
MAATPTLALVSHSIPPGNDGFTIMLSELLAGVPEESLALVGIGSRPWGRRARVRLPVLRIPRRQSESAVMALSLMASRRLAGLALSRRFPRVRRIIATLDPTLGVAIGWARATGAELWVYAIDLHANAFWGAGSIFQGTLNRWRREAWAHATRIFAISGKMADWLRSDGARGEIETLPPLIDVEPSPPPLPAGRPALLFCGWVYSAQGRVLSWIERAVADLAPAWELRLCTPMSAAGLAERGLDPARWTVIAATGSSEVAREVARSSCTIVALDPAVSDPFGRTSLQVAWPTKLREYLSVGRPVLCIASGDYAVADLARQGAWGLLATDEESTRQAIRTLAASPPSQLDAWAASAHRFALAQMDNRTIGRRFRERALS